MLQVSQEVSKIAQRIPGLGSLHGTRIEEFSDGRLPPHFHLLPEIILSDSHFLPGSASQLSTSLLPSASFCSIPVHPFTGDIVCQFFDLETNMCLQFGHKKKRCWISQNHQRMPPKTVEKQRDYPCQLAVFGVTEIT